MSERPKVVVATRNAHKLRELGRMLTSVQLLSLDDVAPKAPDLTEEEDTFVGNAVSKAEQALALTRNEYPVFADDSGLEVDALGGAPGVRSARFAGTHGDTDANNALLLKRLKGVPPEDRGARFRCVIALVIPSDREKPSVETFDGTCEGRIALEPQGAGGFGYDPLFFLPDRGVTVAELPAAEKDAISHRGRATSQLAAHLEKLFGTR